MIRVNRSKALECLAGIRRALFGLPGPSILQMPTVPLRIFRQCSTLLLDPHAEHLCGEYRYFYKDLKRCNILDIM